MADEKKEKWLNWLAVTTVIFAVCATLATFKGGGFSTRAVLSQSKASDQWAFYQSKSIKGYLYALQAESFMMDIKSNGAKLPQSVKDEYQKKIDGYNEKLKTYDEEKKKIEKDARELEVVRDDAQKHSQAFGQAVIFLQIAILLSSIAALMKRRNIWLLGVASGALGIVYFANGFFMFIK